MRAVIGWTKEMIWDVFGQIVMRSLACTVVIARCIRSGVDEVDKGGEMPANVRGSSMIIDIVDRFLACPIIRSHDEPVSHASESLPLMLQDIGTWDG